MADIVGINDRSPRVQPLTIINPAGWQGKRVPERDWLIPGICVRGGATLLNGDGGVGKSLLCMQMQTALAMGKPWLGIPMPGMGIRSLGIYCEDEPDELHRRQADICRYYDCEMRDLDNTALMLSRVGENNTLMSFSRREAGGQITNFFRQIEAMIADYKIEVIIIDTAADTFGGNEIDREQVRSFVQKLRAWALRSRGSVIITQHPSVSGMASGAGSSGSTGWNNSVRSRVYLTAPKRTDDDGDEIPTDERFLKFMKSNYGPKGSKLRLMWKNGVFVTVMEAGPQSYEDNSRTRELLLDMAVDMLKKGIELSPDPQNKSSLVLRARSHQELGRLPHQFLLKAQEELLQTGHLITVTARKANRHSATLIRPSWLKYPDEREGNP
jgi:RecA-family ATPase